MQETTIFKPLYALTHAPINAYFSKNSDDFVVREIPLYAFSGQGEHLIIEICKKDMTTQEALHALSEISGVKMRDFGYAGLKDKQGMTTQFISMPRKFELSSGEEYESIFTFCPKNLNAMKRIAAKTRTKISVFAKISNKRLKQNARNHHF